MLKLIIPNNNNEERNYIFDIIFIEFLGLKYKANIKENFDKIEINLENGKKIIFEDHFFNKYTKDLDYLKFENIPNNVHFEIKTNNPFIPENDLPIIYGRPYLKINDSEIICGIDIFASMFFMLTRWEEYVNKKRDVHDRFIGNESLAYKYNFIDRPIINEYVEMIWNILIYLGFKHERKNRKFEIMLTHDVDSPFSFNFKPIFYKIKNIGADIILRKNFNNAFNKFISIFYKDINKKLKYDDNFTFNYILEQSEKRNLKSHFYFIPRGTYKQQFNYDISNIIIINLIKTILSRGHYIGIHGSYETYDNMEIFKEDINYFRKVLDLNKIICEIKGGRQHFLRFIIPYTYYNYAESLLEYDTTLSYADISGFRCGTCYEFTPFDFIKRKIINIKEIPLIVMDATINSAQYMNLGYTEKGLFYIMKLKDRCKKYNGIFCLLWHNSELKNKKEKSFYEKVLDC